MAEYFDLTCILKGEDPCDVIPDCIELTEGRTQINEHRFKIFEKREMLFVTTQHEDTDYLEKQISIPNFLIKKEEFENTLQQLFEVVDTCFANEPRMLFATGIYEIYYFGDIISYHQFNKKFLSRFPLLFFRKQDCYGFTPSYCYKDICCVYNSNVQQIFYTPPPRNSTDEKILTMLEHLREPNDLKKDDVLSALLKIPIDPLSFNISCALRQAYEEKDTVWIKELVKIIKTAGLWEEYNNNGYYDDIFEFLSCH